MKVTIKGNRPVTGDQVKQVVDMLNHDYGVHVKDIVMRVNLINDRGLPVEFEGDGSKESLTFIFQEIVKKKKRPDSTQTDSK